MIAAALIPAGIAAAQFGLGLYQARQGKKDLAGLVRPEYEIPGAVNQDVAMNRQAADGSMPGSSQLQDQIDMNAANALNAASRNGNAGSSVVAAQANADQSNRQLFVDKARYADLQRSVLSSSLQRLSGFQDQKWQMNKFAPYAEKAQEARDRIGAGQANMFKALDAAGVSAMLALQMKQPSAASVAGNTAASSATEAATGNDSVKNLLRQIDMNRQVAGFQLNKLGRSPLIGAPVSPQSVPPAQRYLGGPF